MKKVEIPYQNKSIKKVYLKNNVWDQALERIRWLFDNFDNIVVNDSGGKDSTIIRELTILVAREKGRLPVNLLFIDQEAEWQCVIDYQRENFWNRPEEINPLWLQCHIRLFNATSTKEPWLHCWDPEKPGEWIREKEEGSIKENTYGTDRFTAMFKNFGDSYFNGESYCHIAGVRAEESPARRSGLTSYATYKHVTWGSVEDKEKKQFVFYPIYDWSYRDVWKAIHDNKWPYCKLYDYFYQYGVKTMKMRVSNVHHETAIPSLFMMQEIEKQTWQAVCDRLAGIKTAGQMQGAFYAPKELPKMFNNWRQYRDHLLENLIEIEDDRDKLRNQFAREDNTYIPEIGDALPRMQIRTILTNDLEQTHSRTFQASHGVYSKNHGVRARKEEERRRVEKENQR